MTLIDKDTILPMTEVDGKLTKKFVFFNNLIDSLIDSAEALFVKKYPNLDLKFTSPFPVGNYKIGFGKEAKKETGLDGLEGKLCFCDFSL